MFAIKSSIVFRLRGVGVPSDRRPLGWCWTIPPSSLPAEMDLCDWGSRVLVAVSSIYAVRKLEMSSLFEEGRRLPFEVGEWPLRFI